MTQLAWNAKEATVGELAERSGIAPSRIRTLQRLRDNLADCIGCGCLSLDRCALSNPGDELASRGPGPRRLIEG